MFEAPDIPGVDEVIAWFGYWPTFHDAEVLSITLDRAAGCRVAIHAFETTAEVDGKGAFVRTQDAVVTFRLEGFPKDTHGITNIEIAHFNQQNVLSSVRVEKMPGGYALILEATYGADGSIVCKRLSVSLLPGIPVSFAGVTEAEELSQSGDFASAQFTHARMLSFGQAE